MHTKNFSSDRRRFCCAGLSLFIAACAGKKYASIDISLFNYSNYAIYDVSVNGTDFGGASAHGFYGSNAIMLGQPIFLGPQKISWKLDGPKGMFKIGETVIAKNIPMINEIPEHAKWLALHVYDDDTVEITFSKGSPDELNTARGKKIIEDWEKSPQNHQI